MNAKNVMKETAVISPSAKEDDPITPSAAKPTIADDEERMDRRTRRTRTALQNALLQLLGTKPLNKITVTELTRLADVNRVTFYAHYQDVKELFDQMRTEMVSDCERIFISHIAEMKQDRLGPLIKDIFVYCDTHEHLFTLLTGTNDSTLYADIIVMLRRICTEAMAPIETMVKEGVPDVDASSALLLRRAEDLRNYQFDYIAGGVVSMLRDWFQRGRQEPVEFMTALATNLTEQLGRQAFARNLALL